MAQKDLWVGQKGRLWLRQRGLLSQRCEWSLCLRSPLTVSPRTPIMEVWVVLLLWRDDTKNSFIVRLYEELVILYLSLLYFFYRYLTKAHVIKLTDGAGRTKTKLSIKLRIANTMNEGEYIHLSGRLRDLTSFHVEMSDIVPQGLIGGWLKSVGVLLEGKLMLIVLPFEVHWVGRRYFIKLVYMGCLFSIKKGL
ncbi:hypothetical protein ACLOJK_040298 [Asimina triloba]